MGVKDTNMSIELYISQIELCDWYINEPYNTTTLYFTAPKEMLNGKYPEAEFMTISVEFPTNNPEACCAGVSYSPTVYDPEEDAYSDYDWSDMDIAYEDVEKLFEKAEKRLRLFNFMIEKEKKDA